MKQVLLIFMMLLAVSFGTTSCSKDDGGEGNHEGEEESGTQLGKDETYDEIRSGVRLILSYDSSSSSFIGTIENTTTSTAAQVRVEVHLSNGTELGPTTPIDMAPGEMQDVILTAVGENFETWSAHPEVG
ncbi:MAG: hypothetical protein K8R74_04655 [Bacteroidales bacterium]|nr:hypothetical protein [Bacteroidales bacterium]